MEILILCRNSDDYCDWGKIRTQYSTGIFFVVHIHSSCSKRTIGDSGERFRGGQYSLINFVFAVLILYLRCTTCAAICKSAPRPPSSCRLWPQSLTVWSYEVAAASPEINSERASRQQTAFSQMLQLTVDRDVHKFEIIPQQPLYDVGVVLMSHSVADITSRSSVWIIPLSSSTSERTDGDKQTNRRRDGRSGGSVATQTNGRET